MKKLKIALLVLALALGGVYIYLSSQCTLNGTNICFDSTEQVFKVEENARVSVQVENQAIADYLLTTWSERYPNTTLDITVRPVLSIDEFKTMPTDIMVVDQKEAAFFMADLRDMGRSMIDVVGSRIPHTLQDAINLKGFYLAQNSVSGPLFVKNKTLMDKLQIDSINTFDDLFNHQEAIEATMTTVLPFSFLDQRSFYPFLTTGGWFLNPNHIGTESGYESEEFLNGLKFVEDLATRKIFGEGTKAVDLPWNFEMDFFTGNSLVSIIEDRVFAAEHAAYQGHEYLYSEFPMYKDHRPAPRAEVRGYVMAKTTEYPSAAAEVVRILRSGAAVSFNEFTTYVPVYHINHFDEVTFTGADLDLVRAYNYSDATSIIGLETDPSTLARAVYQEVDIMDILMRLYDGEINAEAAQTEIVERSNAWYALHAPEETS